MRARTVRRGYGADHRAMRELLVARYVPGVTLCSLCGMPMSGPSSKQHLDHAEDRLGVVVAMQGAMPAGLAGCRRCRLPPRSARPALTTRSSSSTSRPPRPTRTARSIWSTAPGLAADAGNAATSMLQGAAGHGIWSRAGPGAQDHRRPRRTLAGRWRRRVACRRCALRLRQAATSCRRRSG